MSDRRSLGNDSGEWTDHPNEHNDTVEERFGESKSSGESDTPQQDSRIQLNELILLNQLQQQHAAALQFDPSVALLGTQHAEPSLFPVANNQQDVRSASQFLDTSVAGGANMLPFAAMHPMQPQQLPSALQLQYSQQLFGQIVPASYSSSSHLQQQQQPHQAANERATFNSLQNQAAVAGGGFQYPQLPLYIPSTLPSQQGTMAIGANLSTSASNVVPSASLLDYSMMLTPFGSSAAYPFNIGWQAAATSASPVSGVAIDNGQPQSQGVSAMPVATPLQHSADSIPKHVSKRRHKEKESKIRRKDPPTSAEATTAETPSITGLTSSSPGTVAIDSTTSHFAAAKKTDNNKPKRALSAYNIFFKEERQKILDSLPPPSEDAMGIVSDKPRRRKRKNRPDEPHGKISFEDMAKTIGERWKVVQSDPVQLRRYQDMATQEKDRYHQELAAWKLKQTEILTERQKQLESSVEETTKERYFESGGSSTASRKDPPP